MNSSITRKILTIFLASPSDLNEERRLARQTVDDLNKCLGRSLGWHLELLGWEDTMPGCARPQELINGDLALCDLFIGLLWKRWGQETGKFSSGFEEEFTIATNRNGSEGCPEIWLAFKKVDPDLIKDPGDQLKRVIQFRSLRESERTILFKEFTDGVEWTRLLHNWLLSYVLEKSRSAQLATSPAIEIATSAFSGNLSINGSESGHLYPSSQVEELFERISICKDGYPFAPDSSGENLITSFHIARLYLLASAWFSITERRKLLETYSMNAVYQFKETLQTTSHEEDLIFRTIFADNFDLMPGWYWFKKSSADDVQEKIYGLLQEDDSDDIKSNLLNLMSTANLQLPVDPSSRLTMIEKVLSESSEKAQEAILKYLGKHGVSQDITALDSFTCQTPQLRSLVLQVKVTILCRDSPDVAFELARSDGDGNTSALDVLRSYAALISTQSLIEGLKHSNRRIRLFSANELFIRSKVSDESLLVMLNDTYTKIKEIAYQEQIRRGIKIDLGKIKAAADEAKKNEPLGLISFSISDSIDFDKVTKCYYETLSNDDLMKKLDWFSEYGHIAYEVLAFRNFPAMVVRIRQDLEDEFESLKSDSIEAAIQRGSAQNEVPAQLIKDVIAKLLCEQKELFQKFRLVQFGTAAVSAIAEHAVSSDAVLARKYLSICEKHDERLGMAAVKILGQFGDLSDVDLLLSIAKDGYSKTIREEAVRSVLKISDTSPVVLDSLLNSESAVLVSTGLSVIFTKARSAGIAKAKELLDSSFQSVRDAALLQLGTRLSPSDIEPILNDYLQQPHYFYNVVCWLDRLVYAGSLRMAYLSKLEDQVFS